MLYNMVVGLVAVPTIFLKYANYKCQLYVATTYFTHLKKIDSEKFEGGFQDGPIDNGKLQYWAIKREGN